MESFKEFLELAPGGPLVGLIGLFVVATWLISRLGKSLLVLEILEFWADLSGREKTEICFELVKLIGAAAIAILLVLSCLKYLLS